MGELFYKPTACNTKYNRVGGQVGGGGAERGKCGEKYKDRRAHMM